MGLRPPTPRLTAMYEATRARVTAAISTPWNGNSGIPPAVELAEVAEDAEVVADPLPTTIIVPFM